MNVVILTGRLIKDPDVRQAQDGTKVARFTVAIDRRQVKKDGTREADFIGCVAFNKSAEFLEKYFSKGMKAEVRGEWRTGNYTKQDGTKVYTNECFVSEIGFAESKQQTAPQTPQGNQQVQQYAQPQAPQNAPIYQQTAAPQYAPQPTQYAPEQAQQAVQEINSGFMSIPEGVDAEGLPWS